MQSTGCRMESTRNEVVRRSVRRRNVAGPSANVCQLFRSMKGMKRSKPRLVDTQRIVANPGTSETQSGQSDSLAMQAQIAASISRRTFLYSLGALALSACGGEGVGTSSDQAAQT